MHSTIPKTIGSPACSMFPRFARRARREEAHATTGVAEVTVQVDEGLQNAEAPRGGLQAKAGTHAGTRGGIIERLRCRSQHSGFSVK